MTAPATSPEKPPRADRDTAERDAPEEQAEFDLRSVAVQTVWQLVLCILTAGIAWLVLVVMRHALRYRITSQRIEVVSGIFSVTRRTVDLFRITDFEVVEPFFLRFRGAGHITVRSQDAGEPVVTLHAIPDVRVVHEKLRGLVASERRRLHVRVIEDPT